MEGRLLSNERPNRMTTYLFTWPLNTSSFDRSITDSQNGTPATAAPFRLALHVMRRHTQWDSRMCSPETTPWWQ